MSKAELILQYLKTLIWPIVVLFILLSFRGQIGNFLGDVEEAEVFGAKLKAKGANIKELEKKEEALKQALDELGLRFGDMEILNASLSAENMDLGEKILAGGNCADTVPSPTVSPEIAVRDPKALDETNKKLTRDIQNNYDRAQQIVRGSKFERAQELEERGFNQIVEGQFDDALESFEQAWVAFPTYHNVDEIRKLLRLNLARLGNGETAEQAQREVLETILARYSWGVPERAAGQMKDKLNRLP
ncbi:MAG: hypothetical protein ACT4NX_08520 [Deltaproteobacteria bacterium]